MPEVLLAYVVLHIELCGSPAVEASDCQQQEAYWSSAKLLQQPAAGQAPFIIQLHVHRFTWRQYCLQALPISYSNPTQSKFISSPNVVTATLRLRQCIHLA